MNVIGVWSVRIRILSEESRRTRKTICASSTLSTTNPIEADLKSSQRGKGSVTGDAGVW
jgi:hypothetical protein